MKLCTPSYTHPFAQRFSPLASWLRHPFAGGADLADFFDLGARSGGTGSLSLATDLFENADHYFARFEVPGVKKEDIKVELKDNDLTVSATRKVTSADGEETLSLSRTVSLPAGITTEGISAKLENGLLTLSIAKPAEQKPRTITIE